MTWSICIVTSGGTFSILNQPEMSRSQKKSSANTFLRILGFPDFSFASTNPGGFDASPDKILHKPTRDKNKTTQSGTNKHLGI